MQLPRINPVFLTLSGLWTGWLFGQEKIGMMQGAFLRRDYDWQWQSRALSPTFSVLSRFLPGIPCLAQDADMANGSFLADGIAAQTAGWLMNWYLSDPVRDGYYFELERFRLEPVSYWNEIKHELLLKLFDDFSLSPDTSYTYDELFARMICVVSKESKFVSQTESIPLALLPNLQALLNEIVSTTNRLVIEDPSLPINARKWKTDQN